MFGDIVQDWSPYENFTEGEFRCQYTGEVHMRTAFMAALQNLRRVYARPMIITSGYRDPTHPVEARKAKPGAHARGIAADIAATGADLYWLLHHAAILGFPRIGVARTFLHLDIGTEAAGLPSPRVWTYGKGKA
jgi:uncharacterized protein YcbK (DUF882 family)